MYEVAKSRLRDESLGSPRPEIATLLTLLQYIFRTELHRSGGPVRAERAKGVHTREPEAVFTRHRGNSRSVVLRSARLLLLVNFSFIRERGDFLRNEEKVLRMYEVL